MKRTGAAVIGAWMVAVFISGAAVGVLGQRTWHAREDAKRDSNALREMARKRVVCEMRHKLQLSEVQAEKLRGILDTSRDEFRSFRDRHKNELDAIKRRQDEAVAAILSPKQQDLFASYIEERDRRALESAARAARQQ